MPDDGAGQDDVLVSTPELHLPLNKPVKMLLRSKDVNHQFAVPQFRVKMDMVPGMVTYFWFTPTRTGTVRRAVRAAVRHGAFRDARPRRRRRAGGFRHVVVAAADVRRAAAREAKGDAAAGQALFATCTACHGAQAEGNRELNAPKLSGQAGWYLDPPAQGFPRRRPRRPRGGQLRQADDSVRVDARRRRRDPRRGRLHQPRCPKQRPEATVFGDPDKGKAHYAHLLRPATAPTARASGRRTPRAWRT